MKQTAITVFLTLIILCSLAGCTTTDKDKEESIIETSTNTETVKGTDDVEGNQPPAMALHYELEEAEYTGEHPIYDICSYGEHIYFTSEAEEHAGVYEMCIGANQAKAVLADLPEGLIPMVLTVDTAGDLYTVLRKRDENGNVCEMLLWKFDSAGNVVYESDLTARVPQQSSPWAIAVDKEGYVFVRIGIMQETLFLVMDNEGNYVGEISNENEYSHIDALGRGSDGAVYAVLGLREGVNVLARCDGASKTVQTSTLGNGFSGSGLFASVNKGIDCDLVLYGPGYGLCKYTADEEANVYLSPDAFPCSVDGAKGCMLEDGRFLVVVPNLQVEEGMIVNCAEGTMLYYIPLLEKP